MSEQTPLGKADLSVSKHLYNHPAQKKSSVVGLFRLIIAVALVVGGVWLSQQNIEVIPTWLNPFIVPLAIFLAALVFVLGNVGKLAAYIKDSIKEVKKVVWPDRAYTLRMTWFVLVFVAVMAVFIYVVDTAISWLFFDLLLKRG